MRDSPPSGRAPDGSGTLEARFVLGEVEAFEDLYRTWHADVFRWVVRIVRNPATAEDVTAEAFWRAYRSRARFDPSRSFGAWIHTIAIHAAFDALHTARRERPAGPAADEPAAADATVSADIREGVAVALGRLSPNLRVTAVLALIEERPYLEIADSLGISVAAVKVRVFRATRALQRELARLGIRP